MEGESKIGRLKAEFPVGTLCSFIYLVQALVSALNKFFQASFPNGVKSPNSSLVPAFLFSLIFVLAN